MKKLLLLIAILTGGTAAIYFMLPPEEHLATIRNVSQTQEVNISDWFHSWNDGSISIRVQGRLTRPAALDTPLGLISLPAGDFDLIASAAEAWMNPVVLRYRPSQPTEGYLKISVGIGVFPDWIRRPPPEALPTLLTGGWTAYFPNSDQIAWQGGFYFGNKDGEFIYWNQDGSVLRKEIWENGKKQDS